MAEYIDEELLIEKMTRLRGCSCSYSDGIIDEVEDIMSDLPTADVIHIPAGATNGDMIRLMFPNTEIEGIGGLEGLQCVAVSIGLGTSYFALDWWNAPYKRESEDKK